MLAPAWRTSAVRPVDFMTLAYLHSRAARHGTGGHGGADVARRFVSFGGAGPLACGQRRPSLPLPSPSPSIVSSHLERQQSPVRRRPTGAPASNIATRARTVDVKTILNTANVRAAHATRRPDWDFKRDIDALCFHEISFSLVAIS